MTRSTSNRKKVVTNPSPKEMNELEEKIEKSVINQIIKWITEGKSKGDIMQKLTKHDAEDQKSFNNAQKLINKAIMQLNDLCSTNPQETIKAHLETYEKIFDYFRNINHTQGANRALKAKEKLKGILQNQKMIINQTIETKIETEVKYDTSVLNKAELERLHYLLNKAMVNDDNKKN